MGFFGANVWSRDFLGFCWKDLEALRIFYGFRLLPSFDHPCHLKSGVMNFPANVTKI